MNSSFNFAKNKIWSITVLFLWIGVWWLVATTMGNTLLLPSPIEVLVCLGKLLLTENFWQTCGATFLRITIGIILGVLCGILLAIVSVVWSIADTLLSPILTLIKSTPVASFIFLILLWVGRNYVPIIITILMVCPIVWANVKQGLSTPDKELLEVANVFGLTKWEKAKYNYIPSAIPYFISSLHSAFGLGWKAGISAEVLTVPLYSIGKELSDSKIYLETTDLFAWTLLVIILSFAFEKITLLLLSKFSSQFEDAL